MAAGYLGWLIVWPGMKSK